MSKSVVLTGRVDSETAAALDALAERLDRSRAWLINKAISEYVREYTEFLDFIDEGERDIDEGRFYTQEEMEKWLDEQIALAEQTRRAKAA